MFLENVSNILSADLRVVMDFLLKENYGRIQILAVKIRGVLGVKDFAFVGGSLLVS